MTRNFLSDGRRQRIESNKPSSLSFHPEEEIIRKYERAATGIVKVTGTSYGLKKIFHDEGVFTIRVTPLGANMCLLEDFMEGDLNSFIEKRREWWSQWFASIRPWKHTDADPVRTIWLKVYGVPIQAWSDNFFNLISNCWGYFAHCDEKSKANMSLDMAKICIRTSHKNFITESFPVLIDEISFEISLLEDSSCLCVINTRFNTGEDDQTTIDYGEDGFSDEGSSEGDSDKPEDMVVSDKGLADRLMVT